MTEPKIPPTKALEAYTIGELMGDDTCLQMEIWGSDLARAQEALQDYYLDCDEAGGVPIGEVHRYSPEHPNRLESWLLIRQDDGTIMPIG